MNYKMDKYKDEIELLIRKSVLRDVEINLLDKQIDGQIIPETVFETIHQLEKHYETI